MIAAFFFDLDGTLVETEHLWTRAISAWLADHGADVPPEKIGPMVYGRSWLDIRMALHTAFPVLGETTIGEDTSALRAHYARLAVDPRETVIASSVDFFRKASRVAPCAIVSGSPRADILTAAEVCGIRDILAFAMGPEDYARGKPAPDGYLAAAARLGVSPADCIVVEDSTSGVEAGYAAGMRVLGLDRNRTLQQDFTHATWRVKDLNDVEIIGESLEVKGEG